MHELSARCTLYQVKKASRHQFDVYPGAPVLPTRKWMPMRMPLAKRTIIAQALTSPDTARMLDGGTGNASRGHKFALLDTFPNIAKKINIRLEAAGLPPVDRTTLKHLAGKGFTALTADNCCCSTCKFAGSMSYDYLRKLVSELGVRLEADVSISWFVLSSFPHFTVAVS